MVHTLSTTATTVWTADFNGDGFSDILFDNTSGPGIAVWEMVGTQLVTGAQVGTMPTNGSIVGFGDFNGDGNTDLLVLGDTPSDPNTDTFSDWQMNGTQPATITPITTFRPSTGWQPFLLGDFNGDGKTDVTFISQVPDSSNLNDLGIWLMNGSQIASSATVGGINQAQGWSVVGVDDFNGDGKSDFLFSNSKTNDVAVWLMNGTQIQSANVLGNVNAAAGWQLANFRTGDFNGDGKADLLFVNNITHGIAVWLTNGSQVTAAGLVGTLNPAWHLIGVGDFNGDGKSDLLFQNNSTQGVAVWLMNGTQVITGQQVGTIPAGSNFASPQQFQDLNGDHKTDILFDNPTTGAVTAWEMNGTQIAVNQQIGTIDLAHGWHLFG